MTGEPERPEAVAHDPLQGRVIGGKFAVETLLGSGAMGSVYRARQIALDRPVAIKVMHRQLEQDAAYAARFDREAKAASRLDHPNLIRVLDFGREPDGLFYIAMEFLDGRDLFRVLDEDWPLSPARIIDILSQTLAALAAAHDAGILHRDLKPENIMLLRRKSDEGTSVDLVKVCDFGIAKMVNAPRGEIAPNETRARNLSTAGFVVGTPEFMSPEQAHGLDLDGRADVYSVGVILYQLMTGCLPFEAPTPLGVVLKVLHEEAPRPSEVSKAVHPELEAICIKAMMKDPTARFADAREMRAAILDVAHDAGYVPVPRTSRGSLANAPTVDFVPAPPVSQDDATRRPRTSSLDPQEVPKPAKKGRIASALLLATAAAGLLFVFRGRLMPHHDASATNEAPPPTSTTTEAASVATQSTAIAPIAEPPEIQPDSRSHGPLGKHRHDAFAHRNATAPDPPDPPPLDPTPPPPATTIAPVVTQAPPTTASPPVVTAPTPPPPAPPVAVAPSFDVTTAHVDLGTPKASGATPISVSRALAPAAPKITACYRASLNAANAGATTASLHVGTDEDGFITDTHVTGLPFAAAQCIGNEVRGRKILNVDTGNAVADVPLALRPR